jgi:predicted small lipoprotein YifL
MDRKLGDVRFVFWLLLLALVATIVSGCGRSAPADVPPPQQPTATPAEVATPTQTIASQPVSATELPKLLDHLHWLTRLRRMRS